MLLVGLLIEETFNPLQSTSGQASKQAARPAVILTTVKVSKAEELTGQAPTTKKAEHLMKK